MVLDEEEDFVGDLTDREVELLVILGVQVIVDGASFVEVVVPDPCAAEQSGSMEKSNKLTVSSINLFIMNPI